MQGLLIASWYAMQSIHVTVSIVETATCAVIYWQYYIMKIVTISVSLQGMLRNGGSLLFDLKRNTLASLVHFVV